MADTRAAKIPSPAHRETALCRVLPSVKKKTAGWAYKKKKTPFWAGGRIILRFIFFGHDVQEKNLKKNSCLHQQNFNF